MRIDISKNVDIYGGNAEAEAFLQVLEKEYVDLFRSLEDKFAPNASVELSIRSRITGEDGGKPRFILSAVVRNPNTRAMAIDRIWAPNGPDNSYTLSNEYFALNQQFQSFGIADKVNRVGARVLDSLKGNIVKVHANIDVGGYTWLRKGFWPWNGKKDLTAAMRDIRSDTKHPELFAKWQGLPEKEIRRLALTKDFSEFKPLLLNSDWFGEADLNDPDVRAAFTGQLATVAAPAVATTLNEQVFDYALRHQTYLERYSGAVRNQMLGVLDETEDTIAALIKSKLEATGGLKTTRDLRRMNALLETITKIRGKGWAQANAKWFEAMKDLSFQEPIQFDAAIKAILPVEVVTVMPSPTQLNRIAMSRPFQGRTLRQWGAKLMADDLKRIQAAIRSGMVLGRSASQIAGSVVGTGAVKGKDGVTEITRRQTEALVRTAVQDIAAASRSEFAAENQDLFSSEQFVATLDAATTMICKSLDGRVFPIGKGPEPTLHFQCRSTRVPLIDGELIGNRPFKPTTEKQLLREYTAANGLDKVTKRKDLPKGTKGDFDKFARQRIRAMTGTIASGTNYQDWLTKQPLWFQEDTLGKAKAQLFRNGGLTLDKFVTANGNELTLKQIAERHAKAFKLAGLEPADYTN